MLLKDKSINNKKANKEKPKKKRLKSDYQVRAPATTSAKKATSSKELNIFQFQKLE